MSEQQMTLTEMGAIDARITELSKRSKRLPAQLEETRKTLEKAKQRLDAVKGPWEQLDKEIKDREATIKIALDTIEKFEEHMERVTTQKEYLAARKQVDEARKLNERLQDEILERRSRQEELSPQLEEAQQRYDEVLATYEAEAAKVNEEKAQVDAEVDELTGRISGALEAHGTHKYYERLQRGGRRPAIVSVMKGKCTGCNMALPPQVYNKLLAASAHEPFTCPTCSRIIYIPEENGAAEDAAPEAAAG